MSESSREPESDITIALTPPQLAGVLIVLMLLVVLWRRRRSNG